MVPNETGQIVKKPGKKITDRNFRKIPGNSRREFGNASWPPNNFYVAPPMPGGPG